MNPPATHKLILNIKRVIRAPRSLVFAAFASVEELKKWLGPGECHVIDGKMDFCVGGTYRFTMHTTDFGEAELIGTYQEIVQNERICYTWTWRSNPVMEPWGEMLVTVQLADHADGTQVTLAHEGLINEQVRDGHDLGWNGGFDKLASCFGANPDGRTK
ncbi:MAG: hypothetical protein DME21_07465 [Verrucomicrobia bacterium]|nr:MAG: hypothetical protein DME21_07465 [Verrucomicrobiota bacterium]